MRWKCSPVISVEKMNKFIHLYNDKSSCWYAERYEKIQARRLQCPHSRLHFIIINHAVKRDQCAFHGCLNRSIPPRTLSSITKKNTFSVNQSCHEMEMLLRHMCGEMEQVHPLIYEQGSWYMECYERTRARGLHCPHSNQVVKRDQFQLYA